jgi:hypothetical protein
LLDGQCLERAYVKLVRAFEALIAIRTNEECGRSRTYTIEIKTAWPIDEKTHREKGRRLRVRTQHCSRSRIKGKLQRNCYTQSGRGR